MTVTLARDERIGLAIAGLVAAAALGTFVYRTTWETPVPAEDAAADAAEEDAAAEAELRARRAAFADRLHQAFADDGIEASASAEGRELHVRWFKCSKQMLRTLLDRKDDAMTRKLRQASGLSLEALRAAGFAALVCDNLRGQVATEIIRK